MYNATSSDHSRICKAINGMEAAIRTINKLLIVTDWRIQRDDVKPIQYGASMNRRNEAVGLVFQYPAV